MPTTITILNSSFENEELKEGKFTYGSGTGPVKDWNLKDGDGGIYDPKDPKTDKEAPEIYNISGENIAYLSDEGTKLYQQLDYNYVSNEQVTFSIDIGDPDYSDASGYEIRILAGGVPIGSEAGNTSGSDTLLTVTVTSWKIDPTLDGLPITIEIEKVGSAGYELHVDNARASFDILADGIVDGTNSDDTISIGFVDADGDIVDGADGLDDVIDGGAGNDTIDGGDGNDLVCGGIGNDDIDGGTGDDTIFGDSTASSVSDPFYVQYFELSGGLGNLAAAGFDAVGDNSNVPNAEFGRDDLNVGEISLENGGDRDTYAVRFETTLTVSTGGTYTFTTNSDDGSQLFIDGIRVVDNDGLHSAQTQSGTENLTPGEHNVVIIFFQNGGTDNLSSTISGPDTGYVAIDITTAEIVGPGAVVGLPGNDTIDGGDGDDDIFGEGGDDNITVGVGDTATGGADADTFTLDFDQTSSGGSTNINIHGSTTEDAGVDDDTLDLTGFGKFVLTETIDADGDSTSGTAIYDSGQTVNFSEIENLIVCFAKGTHIRAESGIRAIETLKVGDRLMTLDNDLQTIRWVGERSLGDKKLAAYPNLRPIRIKAEALGDGMPSHDLIVSPQHRIVVRSKIAIRMFAAAEVFVPAKHLLGLKGVTIATDITEVTYYHLLCDSHEIIEANGALAETLYTGTEAMKAMTPEALEELALIFGDQPIGLQPLARFSPKGQRAKKLVERHIKNDRAMYC